MYTEPVLERKDNRVNMFIAYFLLFVLFNGKLTLEIALFGVVFAAALYAFSCKYLGYSLNEAKNIVNAAPVNITNSAKKADADQLIADLELVGATVSVTLN